MIEISWSGRGGAKVSNETLAGQSGVDDRRSTVCEVCMPHQNIALLREEALDALFAASGKAAQPVGPLLVDVSAVDIRVKVLAVATKR